MGRFTGIDIKATAYHSESPYVYAGNNPISYNDPLGDEKSWKRQQWKEMDMPGTAGYSHFFWTEGTGYSPYLHGTAGGGGGYSGYSGYYASSRVGNPANWSSGLGLGDWNPVTGSALYRTALSLGASQINGDLEYIVNGEKQLLLVLDGKLGYWSKDPEFLGVSSGIWYDGERSLKTGHYEWKFIVIDEGHWFDQLGRIFESNYSGEVWYDGEGLYGSNFIGPGPAKNPYKLDDAKNPGQYLKPKDMIDAAAQRHDYAYWKLGADGVPGALLNLDVRNADILLALEARDVFLGYFRGNIDPITGAPISAHTRDVAFDIMMSFGTIGAYKLQMSEIWNLQEKF